MGKERPIFEDLFDTEEELQEAALGIIHLFTPDESELEFSAFDLCENI